MGEAGKKRLAEEGWSGGREGEFTLVFLRMEGEEHTQAGSGRHRYTIRCLDAPSGQQTTLCSNVHAYPRICDVLGDDLARPTRHKHAGGAVLSTDGGGRDMDEGCLVRITILA